MKFPPFIHRRPAQYTLAFVIGLAVFGAADTAHAAITLSTDPVSNKIFELLSHVILAMINFFALLTGIFIGLLVLFAQFNQFITAQPVETGFALVRDLVNMLFIVALLMIAAGTVLRLENYRYNSLLGKLIVMAFLTNTSLFIGGFMVQAAQVVMLTFVNAFRDIALGNFAYMFGLDAVLKFAERPEAQTDNFLAVFITMVGGLAMMLIAFVVTAAITVVLLVRILALWILLILSPLAFATQILPNTKGIASKWWSEFTKYVLIGPSVTFFLWLALAISAAGTGQQNTLTNTSPAISQFITNTQAQQQVGGLSNQFVSEAFTFDRLLTFMVSVVFLMLGLQYAQGLGGIGGKWAGTVAKAGFGAATVATGLAAIRDRTVAPVQGWLANREGARKAAITNRTATLEAVGDRMRAAVPAPLGIGRGGRDKAAASAAEYDRTRTGRLAAERGMKNMTYDELQERFQKASGREQVAAMQELQSRGQINLNDSVQRAKFEQLTQGPYRGRGGSVMTPSEQKKLREEGLKANIGNMDEQEVRNRLSATTDRDEQIILGKELEKRKALNVEDPDDIDIVNKLRKRLGEIPADLKQFDDALKKSNPSMALQTIYRGFQNGSKDTSQYIADMQQGLIDGNAMDQVTMARLHEGLVREALEDGKTQAQADDYAESYLLKNVTDSARVKSDFDRIMNSFNPEVKRVIRANALLDNETNSEKRSWVADTGAIQEAYTTADAAGRRTQNEILVDQYFENNGKKIAENFEAGNISDGTIENDKLRTKIIALDEVDDDAILKATKSEYAREKFAKAQKRYVDNLEKSVESLTSKEDNKQRAALVLSDRGKSLDDAWGMSTMTPEERFALGEEVFDAAQKEMGKFVKTRGKNLSKMDYSGLTRGTQEVVVNNINIRSLAEIHDKNPVSTVDIVQAIRTKERSIPEGGRDKKRWEEMVERIDRNDTLTGLGS